MRRHRLLFATMLALLTASGAFATSFVMPTDDELIQKSLVIVTGTVQASHAVAATQTINTVYDFVVDRSMKGGPKRGEMIQIVSPGGFIEGLGGVAVPGSAHFGRGEEVLLFLTPSGDGRWQPTDMTLGKFRMGAGAGGNAVFRREIHGALDRNGAPAREHARNAARFLRYIEDRVAGRPGNRDYDEPESDATTDHGTVSSAVQSGDTTATGSTTQPFSVSAAATSYPPYTYTDNVGSTPRGIRWASMDSGVVFYKRTDMNIAGASDGGAGTIVSGLAAWTNDCGSLVNVSYGGQNATAARNYDGINIVEFNDPQSRIAGSWTGSGTIAITSLSFTSEHQFAGQTWWSITDADVIFQDLYPGTHATFAAAMTHELGHAIGFRHSNTHFISPNACDPSVEECTTAAIMNATVVAGYGYTLQPWDINAARAVYPGGTCNIAPSCTPPTITQQSSSTTVTQGQPVTLSVTATGTAPLAVQWYSGASYPQSSPIAGANSPTLTVTPSQTTTYWARVTNGCGAADTSFITVTVAPPPGNIGQPARRDFNGDARSDIFWRNTSTGQNSVWLMNGTTFSGLSTMQVGDLNWEPLQFGDFNRDGFADIFWRNRVTGQTSVWLMNGQNVVSTAATLQVADLNWVPVGSGDFDANGTYDIFWRNGATGQTSIWFMNGTTFNGVASMSAPLPWTATTFGDFNGDGRTDVFWHNPSTGETSVWLMNGAMPSVTARTITVGDLNWRPAGAGDFNGDGTSDMFWRNNATGANSIWFMSGVTVSSAVMTTAAPTDWTPQVFGNFDGNTTGDIFWFRPSTGETSIWLMSGGAPATAVRSLQVPTSWRPIPSH